MRPAALVLEDGEVFKGIGFGAMQEAFGEVVFNTGMTGYQEVLTDPSYDGQIVTMTYPHVGNYGINSEDSESSKPRVAGFVIRDLPVAWSSHRGETSIADYLESSGVTGIAEVDTRRLTRHIRSRGALRGAIVPDSEIVAVLDRVKASPSMVGADLVRNVTTDEPYEWKSERERFRVAAYDFGIKFNILRMLAEVGCTTVVYPAHTDPEEILRTNAQGVFLSNGPGDPEAVRYGIDSISKLLGRIPLFGICLGHQLTALAVGLRTYKLKFGHRGINHPVARLADGAIEITTQNHGFAVGLDPFGFKPPSAPGGGLPGELIAETNRGRAALTHLNLNDYTVEGFKLLDEPAFCVQYHPEAGPGPHDSRYLFDQFIQLMSQT